MDLSPRLVEILGYLAAESGQTVTKDALLDRFWADVHVTENTLTRAIADIRKALDDDPGEPKFIQTVARRGYRFIAVVDASGAPAAPDPFADWSRGKLSLESLDAQQLSEAVSAFERVVAATTDYAPGHAGLANAYFLQYELTRSENVPDRAMLERAIEHARRACALDPALGEGWATLGFLLTTVGDVDHARAAARRATALEPTSWRHHFRLSVACWGEERIRAAERTLTLMPEFGPARFVTAMVFVARQAFAAAEDVTAKGAARQSQEAESRDSPFPAFGLQWLQGLLQLRAGDIGKALTSFTREMDSRATSIYYREFRVDALVGAGHAHLAANDAAGAADAFRQALHSHASNARALLGLHQALSRAGLGRESQLLLPRVEKSLAELVQGGRFGEAALIKAALETSRGHGGTAVGILEELLTKAPAGQTGWMIPIDPALAALREEPAFAALLARLAARAS